MAFKMKGMNHGKGTGSAFKNNGKDKKDKKNFWTTKVGSIVDDITTSVSGGGTVFTLGPVGNNKSKNKKPKGKKVERGKGSGGAILEGFVYNKPKNKSKNKSKGLGSGNFNWEGN